MLGALAGPLIGSIAGGLLSRRGSSQSTRSTSVPWGPQQPLLTAGFDAAKRLFFDPNGQFTGRGPSYPEYSLVAGFNPLQQAGQQGALGYANTAQNLLNMGQNVFAGGLNPLTNPFVQATSGTLPLQQQALAGILGQSTDVNAAPNQLGVNPKGAIQSMLSGAPNMAAWQPVIESTVTNAANDFLTQVMPQLRTDAITTGNLGTPRAAGAMAEAADRAQRNVLQSTHSMGLAAANDALNRQQTGAQLGYQGYGVDAGLAQAQEAMRSNRAGEILGAGAQAANTLQGFYNPAMNYSAGLYSSLPTLLSAGMLPSQIYQDVGGQQQALTQAQINEQGQRFAADRNMPAQDLAQYMGLISGNYGGTTTNTATTPGNPLLGAIGGGMLGYGMQGMFNQPNSYGNLMPGITQPNYLGAFNLLRGFM